MRFAINRAAMLSLFGLALSFAGNVLADDMDQVEIAKAKAKALFAFKSTPAFADIALVGGDLAKATAEAKAAGKPLYVWVAKYRKDIAERLPVGVHVLVDEAHGLTDPSLIVKMDGSGFQLDQTKLDDATIRYLAEKISRGPPAIKTSRGVPPVVDVEPEELTALIEESHQPTPAETKVQVVKTCLCSPACTCGCNEGLPCRCSTQTYAESGAPRREVAVAAWPASAPSFTGQPVGILERVPPAPVVFRPMPMFRPMAAPMFFGGGGFGGGGGGGGRNC